MATSKSNTRVAPSCTKLPDVRALEIIPGATGSPPATPIPRIALHLVSHRMATTLRRCGRRPFANQRKQRLRSPSAFAELLRAAMMAPSSARQPEIPTSRRSCSSPPRTVEWLPPQGVRQARYPVAQAVPRGAASRDQTATRSWHTSWACDTGSTLSFTQPRNRFSPDQGAPRTR